MLQKLKKCFAILIIIVSLPYIITLFINGKGVAANKNVNENDELLKRYCLGLLAKEVSSDYEDEMLKVQAILVRTTVYQQIEEQGTIFLAQVNFEASGDVEKSWYEKLEKAWDDTEGKVVMYEEKLALVPFHQVSNGKTRNGEEVLGSSEYPYLQIKECPEDVEASNQMKSQFIPVKGVEVTKYDSVGYALSVKVGEETCTGENFRSAYGLDSSCFEVQEFEENTRIITKGVGHGLGLSQYTANKMAKQGYSYTEILEYFFPGTEIREVAEILWDVE